MDLSSFLALGQTALEISLVTALTVFALYLSYTVLGVCDLSTDGCFTLGACLGAVVAAAGHPGWSLLAAATAGLLSGFITAFLQTKLKIDSLLSGIVVNTGLYSVNIAIMSGSSLVNLNKAPTVFTASKALLANTILADQYKLLVEVVALLVIGLFLFGLLKTRLGLALRATGNNQTMVKASSINPRLTITIGLMLSSMITALSGCLLAQSQKAADINIGSGFLTIALASLLLGRVISGRAKLGGQLIGAVGGAILFRLVYTIALRLDMPAFMLKLVSALIVILALAIPNLRKGKRPAVSGGTTC